MSMMMSGVNMLIEVNVACRSNSNSTSQQLWQYTNNVIMYSRNGTAPPS